ncbi:glycosyltransferase [Cohnella algarum]|uniref:glycosyltransferase n=1 Tax=Cohnella algarum TaxID=2044859 RepID=UPI001967ADBA|nr:glycosyltransferase [Cohnella algarum]
MSVYNGELYIAEAIESLLTQTRRPDEIIVVDDGSTDQTRSIIQQYREVTYIYQNNQGPSKARNTAITYSSGDYIAIHDADDRSMPERFEYQARVLDSNSLADMVYCDVNVINETGIIINRLSSEGVYINKEDFLAALLDRQVIPCLPAIMGRRKCFETVPYPENLVHAEDYYLSIEMAKRYEFHYIPEALYEYRRHDRNLTNRHQKQMEAEQQIVKNVGKDEIFKTVERSSFDRLSKTILNAKILMKIGLYSEASALLQKNFEQDEVLFFLQGVCFYQLGLLYQAESAFESAIQQNRTLAEGYNNLGCIKSLNEQYMEASRLFEEALKIRPTYMDAENNLKLYKTKNALRLTLKPLRKVLTTYK